MDLHTVPPPIDTAYTGSMPCNHNLFVPGRYPHNGTGISDSIINQQGDENHNPKWFYHQQEEVRNNTETLATVSRPPLHPIIGLLRYTNKEGKVATSQATSSPQTYQGSTYTRTNLKCPILRYCKSRIIPTIEECTDVGGFSGPSKGLGSIRNIAPGNNFRPHGMRQFADPNGLYGTNPKLGLCDPDRRNTHPVGVSLLQSGSKSVQPRDWKIQPIRPLNHSPRGASHDCRLGDGRKGTRYSARRSCPYARRQLGSDPLHQSGHSEGPKVITDRPRFLASGSLESIGRQLRLPPDPRQCDRGRSIENAARWYDQSSFLSRFLWENLSPSASHQYSWILSKILSGRPTASLLTPNTWLTWVKNLLDSQLASSTVASYVTTALNAAQLKGIDIRTFYPELHRLLSRLALRGRKLGNLKRRDAKGTNDDTRDAFDVPTLHRCLHHIQREHPDFQSNYRILSGMVMVLVALAVGARVSDLPLIELDSVRIQEDKASVDVPNVKVSHPHAKTLLKQKRVDEALPLLKTRRVELRETDSEFSVVKYLRVFLRAFGRNRRFLFSAKPASTHVMSPITVIDRLNLFLKMLDKKTTTHVFRTTNISLARPAGIPDAEIMKRCGWGEEGLLNRYQRRVNQPIRWDRDTAYEQVLGI